MHFNDLRPPILLAVQLWAFGFRIWHRRPCCWSVQRPLLQRRCRRSCFQLIFKTFKLKSNKTSFFFIFYFCFHLCLVGLFCFEHFRVRSHCSFQSLALCGVRCLDWAQLWRKSNDFVTSWLLTCTIIMPPPKCGEKSLELFCKVKQLPRLSLRRPSVAQWKWRLKLYPPMTVGLPRAWQRSVRIGQLKAA